MGMKGCDVLPLAFPFNDKRKKYIVGIKKKMIDINDKMISI